MASNQTSGTINEFYNLISNKNCKRRFKETIKNIIETIVLNKVNTSGEADLIFRNDRRAERVSRVLARGTHVI